MTVVEHALYNTYSDPYVLIQTKLKLRSHSYNQGYCLSKYSPTDHGVLSLVLRACDIIHGQVEPPSNAWRANTTDKQKSAGTINWSVNIGSPIREIWFILRGTLGLVTFPFISC